MENKQIRVGTVSDRSIADGEVRVLFEDEDDRVSDWLPVIVPKHLEDSSTAIPDVNDTVMCAFISNEDGYCLGVIHQGGNDL